MAAKALILSMIQKLHRRAERISYFRFCMNFPCIFDPDIYMELECFIREERKVVDQLRSIVDILRDKKSEDEAKRVDYFISDLVEMAQDALDLSQDKKTDTFFAEMRSILNWIGEIKTRMLKFEDGGSEPDSNMRSENAGEGGDDVVGLDKDLELLLHTRILNEEAGLMGSSSLSDSDDEEHCPRTSLIVGVAGIGKTTLARQVYNHPDVITRFDRRAWVCSMELTNKEVLMKLLQQVIGSEELERSSLLEEMEQADNRSLQQMLHQHLQGMRYFIVFDDLHVHQMALKSIWRGLPHEDNGSRLLLTSSTVTQKKLYYTHEMEPLDSDKSWQLFTTTLFYGNKSANEHEIPKQLVERERDMLAQCGGVRLAIKEMATQIAEKRRSGSEWEQLLRPIDFHAIFEANILSIIQNLESHRKWKLGRIAGDLRMVLDFLRDKKLVMGSKLYHFMWDLVSMAKDFEDSWRYSDRDVYLFEKWTKAIKMGMVEFEDDGTEMRSESVAIEGDDKDGDVVAIGLEEDVDALLRRMISREQELSTCLITGMVGIGKTTLARQVYNHVDVIDLFDVRAWVCVSTSFSHKRVLMKIMQQVVVNCDEFERDLLLEKMDHLENLYLKQMLYKHLEGKRFFIVLDDSPKRLSLDYILEALPFEDKGSRLLVTSRTGLIEYTSSTNYTEYTHWTKTLDPHNSWQLLLKTISSELKFPKHLEGKGRDMLRKCDGLPLAIIEVGKQMARKRQSGSEWEEVLESIDFSDILVLFESIYHKLDPEAKKCFLHLAFFKEHTTIRKEKLQHILATAGIVSGSESESEFESESYLCILIEECMIQIKDKKSYRINAILHALAIQKAEEIGLEILRNVGINHHSRSTHHRVVICSRDKFNYSTDRDEHLVSLFFQGGGYFETSLSYWESFERLLRILDFEDFGLKSLPESIGRLRELRYLGLRNNYIQELPLSLGQLELLEVLDIAQNFMVEVPDIIQEMDSLRYLYICDIICWTPLLINIHKKLVTIIYVSTDYWKELPGLPRLSILQKLGVEELDGHWHTRPLYNNLVEAPRLDHLILRSRFRSMPCFSELELPSLEKLGLLRNLERLKVEGLFHKLLAYNFPPNIEYLKLVNSCLDEDPMPVLEKLPRLKHLKLRKAYTGREMVILHNGFPNLEILCIEESWNLRNVQVGEGAMANLKELEIKSCPCLETLPEEIWSMRELKELKMVTTKRIATTIRKSALKSRIRVVEILQS